MGRREGASEPRNEMRSVVASNARGVMTVEAGAVTGGLEVATHPRAVGVEVAVRYATADEWYTVGGSPIALDAANRSPSELRALHERVVRHLTTPGPVVDGNEEPASLPGFFPVAESG